MNEFYKTSHIRRTLVKILKLKILYLIELTQFCCQWNMKIRVLELVENCECIVFLFTTCQIKFSFNSVSISIFTINNIYSFIKTNATKLFGMINQRAKQFKWKWRTARAYFTYVQYAFDVYFVCVLVFLSEFWKWFLNPIFDSRKFWQFQNRCCW